MDWFKLTPWVVLSGLLFTIFSYIANTYHGQSRTTLQLTQDFTGGALFMGFLTVLIPGMFPDISTLFSALPQIKSTVDTVTEGMGMNNNIPSEIPKINNKSIINTASNIVSLLPKISGFVGGSFAGDDIQLQLGPIPSGSLGH